LGLSQSTEVGHLAQAVMEGVAFAFRDCQRVLADAGTRTNRLLAVGGGSKSDLWLRLLAANLEVEILLPEDGDFGGALGAARLALCAAEGAAPTDVMTMPGIRRVVTPEPDLVAAYAEHYARYRALYPAIEEARQ
jgi:xylulokinase